MTPQIAANDLRDMVISLTRIFRRRWPRRACRPAWHSPVRFHVFLRLRPAAHTKAEGRIATRSPHGGFSYDSFSTPGRLTSCRCYPPCPCRRALLHWRSSAAGRPNVVVEPAKVVLHDRSHRPRLRNAVAEAVVHDHLHRHARSSSLDAVRKRWRSAPGGRSRRAGSGSGCEPS